MPCRGKSLPTVYKIDASSEPVPHSAVVDELDLIDTLDLPELGSLEITAGGMTPRSATLRTQRFSCEGRILVMFDHANYRVQVSPVSTVAYGCKDV